ncbi:hypothetical protein NEPAR03_1965 [Nematocida parisii]|nr:hypothetical protein NEPAR03_1965 [Nematocida parisii]
MKFITQTENTTVEREEIIKRYIMALKNDSVDELLNMITLLPDSYSDIINMSIDNIIRISITRNNPELFELLKYKISDTVKIEYYTAQYKYLLSIFMINRVINNGNNQRVLIREREDLRNKYYKIKLFQVQDITKELSNNIYIIINYIHGLIISGDIHRVSIIRVIEEEMCRNNWSTSIIGLIKECEEYSTHSVINNELLKIINIAEYSTHYVESISNVLTYKNNELLMIDCVIYSVSKFILIWDKYTEDLHNEGYSLVEGCLVLLDYIPVSRISHEIINELLLNDNSILNINYDTMCNNTCIRIKPVIERLKKKFIKVIYENFDISKNILIKKVTKIHKNTKNNKILITDENILKIENILIKYLINQANENDLADVLIDQGFLDIRISPLYFRVLEKSCLSGDASITLFCLSVIKCRYIDGIIDVIQGSTPVIQSYYLSKILHFKNFTKTEKTVIFESIKNNLHKEFFTFNDAMYLLSISSGENHLNFFSYFIKPKEIISRHNIILPDGTRLFTSSSIFNRSIEIIKKYFKNPKIKMYLKSILDINPLYHKIFNIFKYKKDYKYNIVIDPFDTENITQYIKSMSMSIMSKSEKLKIIQIYEICKKISGLFIICFYNIEKMKNFDNLKIIYNDILSVYLFYEEIKKQKKSRSKILPSVVEDCFILKKAMLFIRKKCKIYPVKNLLINNKDLNSLTELNTQCVNNNDSYAEYRYFLLYDMWRIFTGGSQVSTATIDVLRYAAECIDQLSQQEYNYLVKIRIKTLNKPIWENILFECTESERVSILKGVSEDEIYSKYITYILNISGDLSLFLFEILKDKNFITENEKDEIFDKIFFDKNGEIIYSFNCWIPGVSLLQRKEYFECLFEYLKEEDPVLLEDVKASLRKQKFIV